MIAVFRRARELADGQPARAAGCAWRGARASATARRSPRARARCSRTRCSRLSTATGRAFPYTTSRGVATGGFTRRLTFGSVNDGANWVGDEDARLVWGRWDASREAKVHRFGHVVFPDCEDASELKALTEAALAAACVPKVSYEVDVAAVDGGAGVRLGDDVAVIDSSRSPEWAPARPLRAARARARRGHPRCAPHAGHGRAHDVGGLGRRGGARDGGSRRRRRRRPTRSPLTRILAARSSDMAETSTFALAGDGLSAVDVGRVRRAAGRMLHCLAGRRGGARARAHGHARRRGGGSERRHGVPAVAAPGAARARMRALRGGGRLGGILPRVLARRDGVRRGRGRRSGYGDERRGGDIHAPLRRARDAGAHGRGRRGRRRVLAVPGGNREVRGRGRPHLRRGGEGAAGGERRRRGAGGRAGSVRRGRRRERRRNSRDPGKIPAARCRGAR